MRNYTEKEYWAIEKDPYEKEIIRHRLTSAAVESIAKFSKTPEQAKGLVKNLAEEYNRMWDVCQAAGKVPSWSDIEKMINKHYKA